MFKLNFWGVRGSRCTPDKEYIKYGGNTSCVEILIENSNFIFDAGTGFTNFGQKIKTPSDIRIFFTHFHHDHINGLCFFEPYLNANYNIHFYASSHDGASVRDMFERNFDAPYFPITPRIFKAKVSFHDIADNDCIYFLDNKVKISSFPVIHPNECVCYKIEYNSKSVVLCTDTDVFSKNYLQKFIDFIYGTDILIFDGNTADDDYKFGWGHSNRSEALNIFKQANIGKLILTHHDASYTDIYLDEVSYELSKISENILLAREGMSIDIEKNIVEV